MENVNNDLIFKALNVLPPRQDPQAAYLSMRHAGRTYHLFNAARMPLDRIAKMCSVFMRGKNKPTFDPQNYDNGDVCVVVNMATPMIGGSKLTNKKYRHHTGYFSGFREITMDKLLQKEPRQVLYFAIKGMLPKNKLREPLLERSLIVHDGPFHS